MRIFIDNINEFYTERVRLVKTLIKRETPKEYPEPFKWKLQMLYFDGEDWIEICRIDNYLHKSQKGSHIHLYKKDEVKRIETTFQDAEEIIKEICAAILREEFNEYVEFK